MPNSILKKLILTLIIVVAGALAKEAVAQSSYRTGFGIRGGTILGLSVRQFATDDIAIEGFAGYRDRRFQVGALAEYEFNLGR